MAAHRSFIRAAVAAVVITLLGACGGGEEPSVQVPTGVPAPQDAAAAKAFAGPAVKASLKGVDPFGQKKQVLSASVASKFGLTASFRATPARAEQKALAAATAVVSQTDKLFDWAEMSYPGYFPTHQETKNICIPEGCFEYRYYPETDNYVGVQDGRIYLYGRYVDYVLKEYALVDSLKCSFDVDSCRPYVQAFAPAKDAIDVPAKGTAAVFTYNEAINCSGVGGTAEVGEEGGLKIMVELSCNTTAKTVTIKPVTQWPYGSQACFTLGGIRNLAGYGSLPETLCFTTSRPVVASTKVYVANIFPQQDGSGARAAAVIDASTGGVTPVAFPGNPMIEVATVMVDEPTGKAWFGPRVTRAAYAVDLETDQVSMLNIDPSRPEYNHGISGLALTDTELCYTLGLNISGYYMHNVLQCHDKMTHRVSFTSPVNWLGTSGDVAMQLRYLPYNNDKKLYVLVAPYAALYAEDLGQGGFRNGYKPGMSGTVREIDAVTKQVKTFAVGSAPQDIARDPATGDLYVVNTGDHSLSVIAYATGQVQTVPLATFVGREQPQRIIIDRPRGRFYVSDDVGDFVEMGRVVVYTLPKAYTLPALAADLSTIQVVARVPVRRMPIGMAMAGNQLYVSSSWQSSVDVINLDTLSVVQTITGVGTNPEDVAVYVK